MRRAIVQNAGDQLNRTHGLIGKVPSVSAYISVDFVTERKEAVRMLGKTFTQLVSIRFQVHRWCVRDCERNRDVNRTINEGCFADLHSVQQQYGVSTEGKMRNGTIKPYN